MRVCGIIVFLFWVFFFNFRNHIYNAGLKHLRMLHCFGLLFFFQFILFFFSFRITVTVPRAKPMLFLHTTSPFEAKDRGAEMENGAHRAKSLPRAGGEQGGGSGGGAPASSLHPPGPGTREEKRFGRCPGSWLRPSSVVVAPSRALWCRYFGRPWGRRRTAARLYQSQTLGTKYEAPVSAWGG